VEVGFELLKFEAFLIICLGKHAGILNEKKSN
jgi:hypothetical protein